MLVFPHFRSLSDTTCHKIGMLEDSKSMLLLDNCNTHSHKFEQWSGNISVLYFPPSVMRPIQPMDQEVIHHKCYYWQGCLHKLVNHEGTVKDSLHLHYQRCSFQRCLCMEFSEGKKPCAKSGGNCGQL